MRLADALFKNPAKVFEVTPGISGVSVLDWELTPIVCETLNATVTSTGLMDGIFVIEASLVRVDGSVEQAYLDLCLPERIIERHFLLGDGGLVQGFGVTLKSAKIIPAIAIEKCGDYEQYYFRGSPEFGIRILHEGMKRATKPGVVALDLAYILRDEGRYRDAVGAFTVAIEAGDTVNQFVYLERADLYEKLGEYDAAEKDRRTAEQVIAALARAARHTKRQ
jgi:hypothetical protein